MSSVLLMKEFIFSLHNLLAKFYKTRKVYPSETYKMITALKRWGQCEIHRKNDFPDHASQLMSRLEVPVISTLQWLLSAPEVTWGFQIPRQI